MHSKARFEVTVLLVPVFRYEHSAVERWQGACLQSIESDTKVNGKRSALPRRARG
ncbi:MAG: hypothetical protein HC809_09215 [Gammaproteobacteria bacterium]|nr:hypothetical protein [Gammaproteobacteria bacterium]